MEKINGFITRNGFTRSNDFHKSLLKVFQGEFMGRKIMKQLYLLSMLVRDIGCTTKNRWKSQILVFRKLY